MEGSRSVLRHAHLVAEMADVAGLDLADELIEGRITGEDLRQAVVRCSECGEASDCARRLAARRPGVPDEVPVYCRNGQFFVALQTGRDSGD